jgi:hypothetical protein
MCTATIVVSLPLLKPLFMRMSPTNTSNRTASGYKHAESKKSVGHLSLSRSYGQTRFTGDDEIELVLRDLRISQKSSISQARSISATDLKDSKDGVRVTTDVTVTRDVI